MIQITQKEREALLMLFKNFTNFYNANSIGKELGISHVGAQKMLKRFAEQDIADAKIIGKSITYKLRLEDEYVCQLITFLLADEANTHKRWKEEFKGMFKKGRIILIYGSAIKDYAHSSDIDIMAIIDSKDANDINRIIRKKEEVLPKKIHAIKLNHIDFLKSLKNKAMNDIIKNAIVLYGQEKYVEMMKDATSPKAY
ncbi:MAG: nucleotidyltransferase domain-containing protein [Bacteroidota bacterium]